MWHFIAPPDFTAREEEILRGIVEAIQRSRDAASDTHKFDTKKDVLQNVIQKEYRKGS